MAHQSTMKSVLETALAICAENGGEATTDQVSIRMQAGDRTSHKRVLNILSDLLRQGRLSRVRQGVYGPPTGAPPPAQLAEVMWRILRMRRRVTVEDLVEMAGASRKYAMEWLRMLVKREVVVKHQLTGGKAFWQLVNDQLEPPANTDKAASLRALRRKRKTNALKMIEEAKRALGLACEAVKELDD
jgi:transposase